MSSAEKQLPAVSLEAPKTTAEAIGCLQAVMGMDFKVPRVKHWNILGPQFTAYPLVNKQFAIENGHWNSGFTHWKWWLSIVMLNCQKVCRKLRFRDVPISLCHVRNASESGPSLKITTASQASDIEVGVVSKLEPQGPSNRWSHRGLGRCGIRKLSLKSVSTLGFPRCSKVWSIFIHFIIRSNEEICPELDTRDTKKPVSSTFCLQISLESL